MEKYVILNTDDFGMCRSSNLAVEDLFSKGAVSSATIMTPCSWAMDAGRWAAEHPQYAVGVHLTFTSEWGVYRWGPVAQNNTSSLRDKEGFMYHECDEFEDGCDIDEVEAEIRAQIERFRSFGVEPSHLDNHMGSLYGITTGRFELLELTFRLAAEYNLPFRFPSKLTDEMFDNKMLDIQIDKNLVKGLFAKLTAAADRLGVILPDYLIPGDWDGPQKESYENFKAYIYKLYASFPEGVTETYIHPALESDELKGITGNWQRRVWEHRLFAEPETQDYFKSIGIHFISYRDLAEMRRK